MSGPELTVGRGVIAELVRPGRLRGPRRRPRRSRRAGLAPAGSAAPPSSVRIRDERVLVRLWVVARPGQPLGPLADQVRHAVAATVERLLGLELGAVTVLVDGVGG